MCKSFRNVPWAPAPLPLSHCADTAGRTVLLNSSAFQLSASICSSQVMEQGEPHMSLQGGRGKEELSTVTRMPRSPCSCAQSREHPWSIFHAAQPTIRLGSCLMPTGTPRPWALWRTTFQVKARYPLSNEQVGLCAASVFSLPWSELSRCLCLV